MILIACEHSGVVREAFRRQGFDAYSCDLLNSDDNSPFHFVGDMFDVIDEWHQQIELLVAHPPCTYLCSSGLHHNKGNLERQRKTEEALNDVRRLMDCGVPRYAIENPVGRIGTAIRKADQYIQPYQFGHDASKRTGLWLKGVLPLRPTGFVEPRYVDGKPRWANQTDSGQNRLGPSENRWAERSKTYTGIADAMARQWGRHLDQSRKIA